VSQPETGLPVIVLGAGGHAKVLISTLKASGREIIGITDPVVKIGEDILGIQVLGNDAVLSEYNKDAIELVCGIGGLPGESLRCKGIQVKEKEGFKFASVIHPSAVISESVRLYEGVQIMAGCVLQPGIIVGRHSIINTHSSIDHDCIIGEHCFIAPGVTLSGGVKLDSSAYIGVGVDVTKMVRVGKGAIVGAGSIVLKDIDANKKYLQPRSERIGLI